MYFSYILISKKAHERTPNQNINKKAIVIDLKTISPSKDYIKINCILKKPTPPPPTDLFQWKKANNLPVTAKIYKIINGEFIAIKKALNEKGWIENTDPNSPCFNLLWACRGCNINFEEIQSHAVINHFNNSTCITTKVGLCKVLKNSQYRSTIDIFSFYPLCYDLSQPEEINEFIEEYKFQKAQSILKKFVLNFTHSNLPNFDSKIIETALSIVKIRIQNIDLILDSPEKIFRGFTVPDDLWEIIKNDEITPELLKKRKHEKRLILIANGKTKKSNFPKVKCPTTRNTSKNHSLSKTNTEILNEDLDNEFSKKFQEVVEILNKLSQILPQFSLNKGHNTWILKPADKARGEGIHIFNSLTEITDFIEHTSDRYVIQKYVEHPLIVLEHKFDIRQWILVTSYNPVTIWFYKECYLRFGAAKYNPDLLANKFVHLTNNSVNKHFNGQHEIEGLMWDKSQFASYLKVFFDWSICYKKG